MAATNKSLLSLQLSTARDAVTRDVRHLRWQLDVPARTRDFCRRRPWTAMGLGAAAGGATGFLLVKAADHRPVPRVVRVDPQALRPGPPPWLKALGFAATFARPVLTAWLTSPKNVAPPPADATPETSNPVTP